MVFLSSMSYGYIERITCDSCLLTCFPDRFIVGIVTKDAARFYSNVTACDNDFKANNFDAYVCYSKQ